MTIVIKSAKDTATKWSRVTSGRSADFSAGVKAPKKSWSQNALAAEENYKSGVTQAAQDGRFGKGIKLAGDTKWQDKTVSVGVARWGGGVSAATGDFEKGFAPYADVIAKQTLTPRYPKGDPRNIDRVKQIADALHAAKIA